MHYEVAPAHSFLQPSVVRRVSAGQGKWGMGFGREMAFLAAA